MARDQLRLAGRYLDLRGDAGRSLVAVGGTIALSGDSRLRDAAVLIGNTVVVDGAADAELWVIANEATIQGTIGGNLRIIAGDVVILPGTHIAGDVIYSTPKPLEPGRQVQIDGELVRKQGRTVGLSYPAYLMLQALLFAGALVVALPFVRLFPRTVMHGAGILVRAPGRCMLVGIALTWLTPMAVLLLIWFPVTLPLAIAMLGLLVAYAYLAQVIVALVIGGLLLRRRSSPTPPNAAAALFIGLLLLYILSCIPILSVVVWIGVVTAGVGGLAIGTWSSQQVRIPPQGLHPADTPPESNEDSTPDGSKQRK